MSTQTITVELPPGLIRDIDSEDGDRNEFIQEAVLHELQLRRHRQQLVHIEAHPHPESRQWAELGFADWMAQLPEEDVSKLVDLDGGTAVRWIPGEGWHEVDE